MLDGAGPGYHKTLVSPRSDEKHKLLSAEVVRLERELGVLEAQWNKRHYLLLFGFLTIPGYLWLGPSALALGLIGTPALFATQSYLLAVRKSECAQLIAEAKRSIAKLPTPEPTAPVSPPAA